MISPPPVLDPVGPYQWMLRWENPEEFSSLLSTLENGIQTFPPDGLLEPVYGYQSLLLIFKKTVSRKVLLSWLENISETPPSRQVDTPSIQVEVVYEGPDLKAMARAKGVSVEEIIRRHSEPVYTVHCLGFSPGFPYLGPLDPFLWFPRKESPRKHIRPGAVAIGGPHTGIYSIASPGGWHWIGDTTFPCFNREKASLPSPSPDEVFTLKPGQRLQFIPVSP